MRIEWLPIAIDSLQDQLDYIGHRNVDAALSYSRRVEAAVGRLMAHPLLGRSGHRPGTRELVVSGTPFLVVYRVQDDVITVLRLFHGAQDRPNSP
ncbi:type II toxin-antitoxin system RelE/ParE family toxin [Lichenibacterium minor]|uniref:Type II toxin-antitoxin system RelE/ParE family toxin n=1 Tax=Lichenibacterium minor TaxID=2316528 RepID=A0A4Q2UA11_9HYPH|nr:type II toxin-antitoxin system RelE/ParE family toxin [Lichenibacterium minor]RYC33420.1 type II toxin-antitoxin system RelE/ParE family toxin [Lichenibacterium minor]